MSPDQATPPAPPGSDVDRRLLARCRDGDPRAWQQILERYERLVFSIPLRLGLSREDAADITQITFTCLLAQVDEVRDPHRLASWLGTVARRQSWRLLQRERRGHTQSCDERDLLAAADASTAMEDTDTERWERLEWLTSALNTLDRPCRDLLLALYFDETEPSYAEVAARLGRPVGSIGPTRARCLERLRRALKEQ